MAEKYVSDTLSAIWEEYLKIPIKYYFNTRSFTLNKLYL